LFADLAPSLGHYSSNLALHIVPCNTRFWHQFGINSTVINNFIVESIVENLTFFVSKTNYVWYFHPNGVDNPMCAQVESTGE